MSVIRRINPRRARFGWVLSVTQRYTESAYGPVGSDTFFGLIGTAEAGQGSTTSDISASASSPAASLTAGQGSQTSDGSFVVVSDATVDAGQGSQTSDAVAATPFVSTTDVGQGSQTTDIAGVLVDFQQIKPQGWLDGANVTLYPGTSFWKANPRLGRDTLVGLLTKRNSSDAFGDIATDAEFTDIPFYTYLDGFGTHSISADVQRIYPTGIASTAAFGTATVYNYNQSAYPTGISSTLAFGTPRVENYFRCLYPTGLASSTTFGTATIANLNRELTLSGIDSAAYGMAHIYDPAQFIRLVGFDWLNWGTASIINNNRYLSPSGTKFDTFGTAHVENSLRYVYAQRIDPKGFGTATIYNLTQYKAMSGFKDDVFGTAYIIGPRYLRPTGWKSDKFLPTNEVSNYYRTVYPTDIPATFPATGNATIYNEDLFVFPEAIEPEEMFGAIVAMPPFDIIDVTGNSISESEITNEADIYYASANHIYVRNTVFADKFGRPTLTPATIATTAISSGTYGRPTVSNYTRYITPASIGDVSRYGTQWVSHYIRYVEPRGFDSSVVWYAFGPINEDGTIPGVKGSAVYIYPDGFDASGTTYDPCGFPRTPPIPRPSVHP